MLLYTIMPEHVIFPDSYQVSGHQLRQINHRGVDMLVQVHESGHPQIARLLSTEPSHYLDPLLQPGTVISPSPL